MSHPLLLRLSQAGVVECARSPRGMTLRANPRFLAHAEQVACRRNARSGEVGILGEALSTWDDEGADLGRAAPLLAEFLGERHQMGLLRPVFPVLEQFGVAA